MDRSKELICIKARLVAEEADGAYTTCVFQDLIDPNRFIMMTRVPNWQGTRPTLLQEGFLEYKFVNAGDKYYHTDLGREVSYQYTNHYFVNFVPITHVLRDGYVTQIDTIQIK